MTCDRAPRDKVYVKQIIDLVRSLEAARWSVPVPFGENLSPLGSKQAELILYDKLENYGTSDRWLNLLRNTANSFDMSGLSLRWWTRLVEFRPLILQKAQQGCKIRCLLNPSLTKLFHQQRLETHLESLGVSEGSSVDAQVFLPLAYESQNRLDREIQESFAWLNQIAALCPNFEVRLIRIGSLGHQIVKTDSTMLAAIPLYSRGPTSQFPLLECSSASPLYRAIAEEFNSLWALNGPEATAPTGATNQEERTTEIARNKNHAADAHMETK